MCEGVCRLGLRWVKCEKFFCVNLRRMSCWILEEFE